ncbi:MAG: NAD-glutamate dehydrogenase [Desulfuromonadaceae bacterium]
MNTSADQQELVREFQQKLNQVQAQLAKEARESQELMQIESFIELLYENAVPADLVELEVHDLKELCLKMFTHINQRKGELGVNFFPMDRQDQGVLVCSCDEAPFLLDSLLLLLRRQGLCWQVVTHLRLKVARNNGNITSFRDAKLEMANESLLIIQSEGPAGTEEMLNNIRQILTDVLRVASDRGVLQKTLENLQPEAEKAGYGSFWNWLTNENFVPLSYRQLHLKELDGGPAIELVEGTELGIAVDPAHNRLTSPQKYTQCDARLQACITQKDALAVTQSGKPSPVWRDELLTSISLRGEANNGEEIIHDIAGLYTQHSRGTSALDIKELRTKAEQALTELGIAPESYNYRKTEDLLSTFPITELFFLDKEQLQTIIKSLLFFHHSSVRTVLLDHDSGRLNLLLIIPRSLNPGADFSSLETYMKRLCSAEVLSSQILHLDAEHFIVQVQLIGSEIDSSPDLPLLSDRLTEKLRSWEQKLRQELILLKGSKKGMELWQIYRNAFCDNYRARVSPKMCINDINMLERVRADKEEHINMWKSPHSDLRCFLKFYSTKQDYLNELMPLLVNLDLIISEEVDYIVRLPECKAYIKSFGVLNQLPASADILKLKDNLVETLSAMRQHRAENDYLNRLVVHTGLDWQQIDVFRAYRNYYFQLGSPFTKRTVAFALINNPRTSKALYNYFEARFKPETKWADPMVREEEALSPTRMELIESLAEVSNVNEDRILRTMFNLIDSTVRTNFFVRRTQKDYFISMKISSIGIAEMPAPRPMFEVYVHNAAMEGIHLRGGKVARGGIRWSDRPDDFRTEVLGLMKTQMTKNTLIVPVGSKGGFVVKTPFTEREEGLELSKRAYETLMRGLLDLTDNRKDGEIITPENIVRYDEQDSYLVVAADKGTAHLSDTANAISAEYNFWLDDGFASGGSQGYDHKELGITARGAWVCVQRHFREMGIDIQSEPFTVMGIGDMGGDVFGNGMLLSEQIKLCAAFNHLHIFLDPNPDPASSFTERKRLFELPRSSWSDYNKELISSGGGVFERHAKEIPLSPEVQKWLGVRHASVDGDTLVRMLLQAPTDLLWNGGIGTYVKHSQESNTDVGDRANDNVRIDGNKLRARVIGEGGNLGFTQMGRIEYALNGGRINTDAVDNSGGVDCSDHEVNLKIFMQYLKEQGQIKSEEERNTELQSLTTEVCDAVLHNNYTQSMALSLDKIRNNEEAEVFSDLATRLEEIGLLNSTSEALPKTKDVLARKEGYTRPELAILLAYSKMSMFNGLLASDYLDSDFALEFLGEYYPQKLHTNYAEYLNDHPLRREIIATMITNHIVDQSGATTCFRLARRHNIELIDIVPQYLTYDRILNGEDLRAKLYALDNKMPAEEQYTQLLGLETALATMCDWSLRQGDAPAPTSIPKIQEQLREYRTILSSILTPAQWKECRTKTNALTEYGLDEETAMALVTLPYLDNFIPLVQLQEKTGEQLYPLAETMAEAMQNLQLESILQGLEQVPLRDRWDRRSNRMLKSRFQQEVFNLIEEVMRSYNGNIDSLLSKKRAAFMRYKRYIKMLGEGSSATFHPYMVILDQLQKMLH